MTYLLIAYARICLSIRGLEIGDQMLLPLMQEASLLMPAVWSLSY